MKIIEALKQLKDLDVKAKELRTKIQEHSAYTSLETPRYPDQKAQVTSWLQAHRDVLFEIETLGYRLQKTNILTQVTIAVGGKDVTKSILQWISRRTKLAELERQSWAILTDRNIKEGNFESSAGPTSENPELAEQKKILRTFLDLKSDGNRQKQKDLISAAVKYVDTSDSRLKGIQSTLGNLGKHAEVMGDSNSSLRNMHLIMDEGIKDVIREDDKIRNEFINVDANESSIARMTREEKLAELNEHMTTTNEAAIDIANSIGGLTKHSVQIQTYRDTLRNEQASTKRLHLEGVSQMGEQLMSVISAISAAATTESRSLAANNFAKMSEQNQMILTQEVVKNASNIEIEANQISKLVGELEDYGQVLTASNQITAQGYDRMRSTVNAIRKVADVVQDGIKELVSEHAGVNNSGDIQ